jgi:hypothetical protein
MAPPIDQISNPYQTFMIPSQPIPSQHLSPQPMQTDTMQISHRPLSLNKELPPAPLLPSPMDVDFNMFGGHNEQMLKPPGMEDWQSLTSSLIEDQAMTGTHTQAHQQAHNSGFPISWEDLGQYGQGQGVKM